MSIMMKLGEYSFAIDSSTYQRLSRTSSYRWQAQNRIGNDSSLQYVGKGNEQIELEGVIYPHFKGGLEQLPKMREMANTGKPLLLVDGLGNIHDDWVITAIEEAQEVFAKAGVPRKISFRLSLTKYNKD